MINGLLTKSGRHGSQPANKEKSHHQLINKVLIRNGIGGALDGNGHHFINFFLEQSVTQSNIQEGGPSANLGERLALLHQQLAQVVAANVAFIIGIQYPEGLEEFLGGRRLHFALQQQLLNVRQEFAQVDGAVGVLEFRRRYNFI